MSRKMEFILAELVQSVDGRCRPLLSFNDSAKLLYLIEQFNVQLAEKDAEVKRLDAFRNETLLALEQAENELTAAESEIAELKKTNDTLTKNLQMARWERSEEELLAEIAELKAKLGDTITFDGKTAFEFVGEELFKFQNVTGCDTAEEFKMKPTEIIVEIYSPKQSGWFKPLYNGVKITHIPSGVSVTCEEDRSVHRNKFTAMSKLVTALKPRVRCAHNTWFVSSRSYTISDIDSIRFAESLCDRLNNVLRTE